MKFLLLIFILSSYACAHSSHIPEASGAAQVGNSIVIAGDEEPRALWLFTNNELTKASVSGGSWDDMEGLAGVDGKRFFAVTSHSLTKKGKRKPEREQLFLMTMGQKIEITQRWTLRDAVITYLETNLGNEVDLKTLKEGTPDQGGLNIEGLAFIQDRLYIGLRSPLTKKGEAIVLVIKNATSSPVIESTLKLPLSGNGIRGLDSVNNELYVLSGPVGDRDGSFGLFSFSETSRLLTQVQLTGFQNLMRPESLVKIPNGFLFVQDFESPENQDVIQVLR